MRQETQKCHYCERIFDNKKSLSNHMRWHKIPKHKMFQTKYKARTISDQTKKNISKGLKSKMSGKNHPLYGKKTSDETKLKQSLAMKKIWSNPNAYFHSEIYKIRRSEALKGKTLGNKSGLWKGNLVGLVGLHNWVRRHKPKPKLCIRCKKVPPRDLANISQKYKRDIDDFDWLCRRCHMESDGRIPKDKCRGEFNA